nr:MAG TPA: hypothetical protein [Caudoviricetes sp.]
MLHIFIFSYSFNSIFQTLSSFHALILHLNFYYVNIFL